MRIRQNLIVRALLSLCAPLYMVPPDDPPAGTTPPASGTPPAPAPGAPPAADPPAPSWYASFENPEVKEWLGKYGNAYPNAESVAAKALHLERFVGAEKAGRGVIVPKADAKPEEWSAFYRKVGGVPEKVEEYKLPGDLGELSKDPVVGKFREFAHKAGMPPVFFGSALQFMGQQLAEAQQNQQAEFERRGEAEMNELRSEWQGVDYDKNVELGRRAAKAFIPHENPEQLADIITRMEGAIGTKMTLKMLANIGGGIGEHSFVQGDGGSNISGGMTPEAARVRISELTKDVEWSKAFIGGDVDKKAEWDRLHKIAYSG